MVENRPAVLVVDDNQTHQYSLGRHLEHSGFAVLKAQTGMEAVKMAVSEKPSAVLLDINLPDMSGFEVCEKLKSDPRTASVPIIFHSATHDTQSARDYAIDLGAVSFLSYPINPEHLTKVLEGTLLRTRNRRSERFKALFTRRSP